MSSDLPPFLFLLTSTAIVLGVAITLRGLFGFVSDSTPRLPATPSARGETNEAGSSPTPSAEATGPRDLAEPMIMTIAGIIITAVGLLAVGSIMGNA
ncbi:MAG: hypothetical protein KF809_08905 [Chloroflexi bacterium]|nr:hypothetical protein [Chloroflexota bacterium]